MKKIKILLWCCVFGGLIGFYSLLVWNRIRCNSDSEWKTIENPVKIYQGKWHKNYLERLK